MWCSNTHAMPPGPVVLELVTGEYVEANVQHTEAGFYIYSDPDAPRFELRDVRRWQDFQPSPRTH